MPDECMLHVEPTVPKCRSDSIPRIRTYLNWSFLMYSMIMSFSGCSCSSLRVRHMNSQGLRAPPKVPPHERSSTALSMRDSAVSPKQCSFQYWQSYILQRTMYSTRFCEAVRVDDADRQGLVNCHLFHVVVGYAGLKRIRESSVDPAVDSFNGVSSSPAESTCDITCQVAA
jgi:hypothetical protein